MITSNSTDTARRSADDTNALCSMDAANDLIRRVSREVDSAEKRIIAMRCVAAEALFEREQRLAQYLTVAHRIREVLKLRLGAFRKIAVFDDLVQTESPEYGGSLPQKPTFSRTTTLAVVRNTKHPHPIEFSFRVDHDESVKNAVIDYRLKILPIFIKFNAESQLLIPIDKSEEQSISNWIDDRLVDFTRTYFEVYFHKQYQR